MDTGKKMKNGLMIGVVAMDKTEIISLVRFCWNYYGAKNRVRTYTHLLFKHNCIHFYVTEMQSEIHSPYLHEDGKNSQSAKEKGLFSVLSFYSDSNLTWQR